MAARLLIRRYLVEDDLFCDHGVVGLDGNCIDGSVGDGVGCCCFPDEHKVGLVVVESLLQSVGSSYASVVPD